MAAPPPPAAAAIKPPNAAPPNAPMEDLGLSCIVAHPVAPTTASITIATHLIHDPGMNPPWYKSVTRHEWKTLIAAQLGWMLDAMDVMLYSFALSAIRDEFSLTSAAAGALASVTLIASAFGGALFGILADRFGRAKALVYSILTYSVFTALTATSRSIGQIILWRSLVGLGLGIVFNQTVTVRPGVHIPMGLQGASTTFGAIVSVNFGRAR